MAINELKSNPDDNNNNFLLENQDFNIPPAIVRMRAYQVDVQLNYLFDDIEAGLFGEEAKTGKFYEYVVNIKQSIPKT